VRWEVERRAASQMTRMGRTAVDSRRRFSHAVQHGAAAREPNIHLAPAARPCTHLTEQALEGRLQVRHGVREELDDGLVAAQLGHAVDQREQLQQIGAVGVHLHDRGSNGDERR